jgi:hypothetical protein
MYLITDEEAAAVKAMRQAYDRLKELGWEDILRFKPEMIPFGSAPFLGIEVGSYRPIVRKVSPAQPVDATQALNLSAGVSNCKVSRGRSFS